MPFSRSAITKWAQNWERVIVTFQITDCQNIKISIKERSLEFTGQQGSKFFENNFELFEAIDTQLSYSRTSPAGVVCYLAKLQNCVLTGDGNKLKSEEIVSSEGNTSDDARKITADEVKDDDGANINAELKTDEENEKEATFGTNWWPRLTFKKTKFAWLGIDFNNWHDEESDEVDEDMFNFDQITKMNFQGLWGVSTLGNFA